MIAGFDISIFHSFSGFSHFLVLVLEGYLPESIQTKARIHQKQSEKLIFEVETTYLGDPDIRIHIFQ